MRPAVPLLAVLLAGCLGAPAPSPLPGADDATTWIEATVGPTPRTEVVVAAVDGRIHVIGGFTALAGQPKAESLVEVYDVATDAWSRGPDYPLQVHHSAAVEVDGVLYVLGGLVTAAFQPTSLAFRLDPGAAAWRPIAPLPAPRGGHAAAVLDGKVYLAGGVGATGHVLGVLVYDPERDAWGALDEPLPTPRDHTAAAAVGGLVCVLAGDVGGHSQNTDATECVDPATGKWMRGAPVPTLRGSVAAVAWRDRAVVLGGQNATDTFAAAEAYDVANDTWVALPPLLTARHGFGAVVVDDAVWAAYGGPEPGLTVTASVERLGDARLSASTSS